MEIGRKTFKINKTKKKMKIVGKYTRNEVQTSACIYPRCVSVCVRAHANGCVSKAKTNEISY